MGFAFYASVLVRFGKTREGLFYGKLARQIMEKYPVKEFEARTTIALWGNVMTESEPLRQCVDPYMSAHHAALSTGDFNVCARIAVNGVFLSFSLPLLLTPCFFLSCHGSCVPCKVCHGFDVLLLPASIIHGQGFVIGGQHLEPHQAAGRRLQSKVRGYDDVPAATSLSQLAGLL